MTPAEGERRSELLAAAAARRLSPDELVEIGVLERRHHDFRLLCTRTAPLNPMALGYAWDERIVHAAAPAMPVRVRTEGNVDMEGEVVSLMEATRRVATATRRGIALADWSGPTGRLGDIAGLEHPPRVAPSRRDGGGTADAHTNTPRTVSKPAAMGDLFD